MSGFALYCLWYAGGVVALFLWAIREGFRERR